MQLYLGKKTSSTPEQNQGLGIIIDLVHDLKEHNLMCNKFLILYDLRQIHVHALNLYHITFYIPPGLAFDCTPNLKISLNVSNNF